MSIMKWNQSSNNDDNNVKSSWANISGAGFNISPTIKKLVKLLIIVGILLIVVIILSIAKGIWTEWLWFSSLNLSSVYSTVISTKMATFFIAAVIFIILFTGNLFIARRIGPKSAIPFMPSEVMQRIRKLTLTTITLGTILLSIIFGSTALSHWEIILKFQNGQAFGTTDPIFHKDISFYVFSLPFQHFIQGWLLSTCIVILVVTIAYYFIAYRIRRLSFNVTTGVKAHISSILAIILGLFAWKYFLDIWNLVYSERGAVFGAGYTDVHAQLVAYKILIAIVIICAIIVLANIFLRGFRLPVYAFGIFIIAVIVISIIYPAAVQRFQVKPAELTKERQYIEYNISLTRAAFALDRIEEIPFSAKEKLTQNDIEANPTTINNIRLWDHRPLKSTYHQEQALRPYYDFYDVDIDRYIIDGQYRQVMLSARELYQENFDKDAQKWVNQRLVYTHGYGVVLSPVNEVTDKGAPILMIKDIPPDSGNHTRLQIDKSEIYFGEKTNNYILVNTNTEEFDYPKGDNNIYTEYKGSGGISLNSLLRRAAYAWYLGDLNILISDELTSNSKLLYYRNIQDRVHHVAPFLQLDSDPYLVITEEGRLIWIIDAYTWSNKYPYSQPLNTDTNTISNFSKGTNYIRNSVKAAVDAYDGTVTLYVIEPEDPVIKTYQAIFPTLFTSIDKMPADIKSHLRYPEGMFTVQAQTYLRYHMQDPKVFYGKEDLWSFPEEIYKGTPQRMQPYYMIMRLPDEEKEEFLLMLPFTPANKKNTISWLAARSDSENYGKLLTYYLPKDKLVYGPSQIENRIEQDLAITEQFALWGRGGSTVIRGNLLMIPIEDSFLYIEPVFLQGTSGGLPEFKRVIVATGEALAMEDTLDKALAVVFGQAPPTETPTAEEEKEPPLTGEITQLITSIQEHQLKEKEFAGAGNWEAAGKERVAWEIEFQQLVELLNQMEVE